MACHSMQLRLPAKPEWLFHSTPFKISSSGDSHIALVQITNYSYSNEIDLSEDSPYTWQDMEPQSLDTQMTPVCVLFAQHVPKSTPDSQ